MAKRQRETGFVSRGCSLLAALMLPAGIAAAAAGDDGSPLTTLTRTLGNRGQWIVLAAVLLVILVVAVVVYRRGRKGIAALLLAAVFLVAVGLGIREFGQRYPHQGLLSGERFGDAIAILLGTDIRLGRYDPEPVLVVQRERVDRLAFPATDFHWHLDSLPRGTTPERLVQAMDAAGIQRIVNLDGLPDAFERGTRYADRYPGRFVLFVKPDLAAAVRHPGGLEAGIAEQVRWMEDAARRGAQGVKISKSLGMGQRTRDGRLVAVDDPRLDPLWRKAGELGLPVLIHTGDPVAFFLKPDARNERLEEMLHGPDWVRYGREPSRETLFKQRENLLAKHPGTNFVGAHFGMQEDDLAQVAALLDRFPNYYVDTAAILHAIGRQPHTARRFFLQYKDRILFGTDGGFGLVTSEDAGWTPERLFRSYAEFFETANEYVEYPLWGTYNQGRWRIYGIDLPDDVLQAIYQTNAERLIPTREAVAQRLAGSAAGARQP